MSISLASNNFTSCILGGAGSIVRVPTLLYSNSDGILTISERVCVVLVRFKVVSEVF